MIFPTYLMPLFGHRGSRFIFAPILTWLSIRKLQAFEKNTLLGIQRSIGVSHDEARRIYRQGVRSHILFNLDYFFLCRSPLVEIRQKMDLVKVVGINNLKPTLKKGRPLLIITMHMGDFQLGFLKLASMIEQSQDIVMLKLSGTNTEEEVLLKAFQSLSGKNVRALHMGESGGKKAFYELRKGNIVAMAIDAEVNVTSREEVVFFNNLCQMQKGPATLAALTGATIIPVINFVDSEGIHNIRVEAPISVDRGLGEASKQLLISRATQNIAQVMESWIKIDPSQVHIWTCIAETMLNFSKAKKVDETKK